MSNIARLYLYYRFIRAMADAMGGEEGENYARFKTFCCQVSWS